MVTEKITGISAESEIRRRIPEKLGMGDTYLEGFEKPQTERLARRYHYATEEFRKTARVCLRFTEPRPGLLDATGPNLFVEWVYGGILSFPKDLLKFAVALRNGHF